MKEIKKKDLAKVKEIKAPAFKQLPNLYLPNYYLRTETLIDLKVNFLFIIGGRRIGKTFNALRWALENGKCFLFMRRTQKQIKLLSSSSGSFNPFKSINKRLGYNIQIKQTGDTCLIYEEIDGEIKIRGYAVAITDLANMRGFDGDDIETIIFDEFIPLPNERVLKKEEYSFNDIYDTINSNRELEGREAVKCILCANANELANPIMISLNLVRVAEMMIKQRLGYKVDHDRGYAIIFPNDSPIADARKETALYRLIGKNNTYSQMALFNSFNTDDTYIKPQPIKEYKPLVNIGEIVIYKHKSKSKYYACEFMTGSPPIINADSKGLEKFTKHYGYLYDAYIEGRFLFEDYLSQKLFEHYFK